MQTIAKFLSEHPENQAVPLDGGFSREGSAHEDECAQGSLGLGNLVKKRSKPRNSNQNADEGGFEQRAVNGQVGASHGYGLYAGNAIDADDKVEARCGEGYSESCSVNDGGNVWYREPCSGFCSTYVADVGQYGTYTQAICSETKDRDPQCNGMVSYCDGNVLVECLRGYSVSRRDCGTGKVLFPAENAQDSYPANLRCTGTPYYGDNTFSCE